MILYDESIPPEVSSSTFDSIFLQFLYFNLQNVDITGANVVLRLDPIENQGADLVLAAANAINESPGWRTLIIHSLQFSNDVHNAPAPDIYLECDGVGRENVKLQQLYDRILDVNIDMGAELDEVMMTVEDSDEDSIWTNPRKIPGIIKHILKLYIELDY